MTSWKKEGGSLGMSYPSYEKQDIEELIKCGDNEDSFLMGEKAARKTNTVKYLYNEADKDIVSFLSILEIRSQKTTDSLFTEFKQGLRASFHDIPLKLQGSQGMVKKIFLRRLDLGI